MCERHRSTWERSLCTLYLLRYFAHYLCLSCGTFNPCTLKVDVKFSPAKVPEVFFFFFSSRAANEKAPKEQLWGGEENRACYCLPSLHACLWETETAVACCVEKNLRPTLFLENPLTFKNAPQLLCTHAYWCVVTLTIWAEREREGESERA